jgi:hypothetical protein
MNKRYSLLISLLCLIIFAGALLASCRSNTNNSLPDGKTLLQTRCSLCHSTVVITTNAYTIDQWKMIVDQMKMKGAQLTPQEETILVNYLAQTYK